MTIGFYPACDKISISTHTLTWSVTFPPPYPAVDSRDFNSHAHVERDNVVRAVFKIFHFISTHTLTWSVTFVKKFCKKCLRISTHTLTWSVTKQVADDLKEYSDFNSHAHVERDATILIL